LKISEREVENEVQDKRQSEEEWELALKHTPEDSAERDCDQNIKNRPDRSENP